MQPRDDQPQKVTFPRWGWIAMGLLLSLQVVLLVINNLQIGGQLAVVKQQRDFQAQADPLADKLLVTAALVSLVSLDRVAAWVAMVIIAREFAVTGLRTIAAEKGQVVHASGWGKLKTSFQIAAVLCLILVPGSPVWVDLLVYAAVVVTVMSGVDYFWKLRRLLSTEAATSGATLPPETTTPRTSSGSGT